MLLPTQSWSLRVRPREFSVFERLWVLLGHLSPEWCWRGWWGERGGRKGTLVLSPGRELLELLHLAQAGAEGRHPEAWPRSQSPALSPGPQFHSLLVHSSQESRVTFYSSLTLSPPLTSPPPPFLPYSSPLPSCDGVQDFKQSPPLSCIPSLTFLFLKVSLTCSLH